MNRIQLIGKPFQSSLISFAILLAFNFIGSESHSQSNYYEGRILDADVSQIRGLLEANQITSSTITPEELEKLFKARAIAHRLRLSEMFLDLAKDAKFVASFPEFEPLLSNPSKAIDGLLEHDASKTARVSKNAIKILSMLQGFDFRNPNKGLPKAADDQIRKALKKAIDEINLIDKRMVANMFKAISPDPKWAKLHAQLTETLDYYDTYKSRQNEIAKDGRKLLSPSEWIEKIGRAHV